MIRIVDKYLKIMSSYYVMFTLMFIYTGLMRGAGDTLVPMFFSLLSLWIIRIPFAWIFSQKMGPAGIWWSIPAGWFVGLMLSWGYYRTGRWKTKAVVKYELNK